MGYNILSREWPRGIRRIVRSCNINC